MINQVYQLVAPRQIEVTYNNEDITRDKVIVRPLYLSICAADQRYYTGSRNQTVLEKKLPMSLIHEGVGEVVYDSKGEYKIGTKVIMVPNMPVEEDEVIAENYLPSSKFRSSGYDGFMQDYVFLDHDRVVAVEDDIDLSVGIVLHKKVGDSVDEGEALLTIHSNREQINDVKEKLNQSITISSHGEVPTLIHKIITE